MEWYDYIPGTGSGWRQKQGNEAIQSMLEAKGYSSLQEFQLDHPSYGGGIAAGNLDAIKAGASIASGAATVYLTGATAVTPAAAGTRCTAALAEKILSAKRVGSGLKADAGHVMELKEPCCKLRVF